MKQIACNERRGRMLQTFALALLLAFAATFALAAAEPAYAADDTYSIRVWGGNEGTVQASQSGMDAYMSTYPGTTLTATSNTAENYVEISGFEYDTYANLQSLFTKSSSNDKYYAKAGLRPSGDDNGVKDANLKGGEQVTQDLDYVVAYGVRGNQVDYTVNYVEYQTGRVLRAPQTFQGNIDDRAVVAFEYIEGYRPLYRNIAIPLTENANNNVITFEYVRLAAGENAAGTTTTTTTTTVTQTGGAATTTATTAGAGAAAGAAGGAAAGTAASDASASAESAAATTPTTPPATEEILDVANPLADGEGNNAAQSSQNAATTPMSNDRAVGLPIAARIAIGVAAVAAIAGVAFAIRRRRQNDDNPYQL